jgi:hypothetical protein
MEELKQKLAYCSNILLMDHVLYYLSNISGSITTSGNTDPVTSFRDTLKSLSQQKWVITRNNNQIQPCMRILQSMQLAPLFEGKCEYCYYQYSIFTNCC